MEKDNLDLKRKYLREVKKNKDLSLSLDEFNSDLEQITSEYESPNTEKNFNEKAMLLNSIHSISEEVLFN